MARNPRNESATLSLAQRLLPLPLLMRLRRTFLAWEVLNERGRRETAMNGLSFLVRPGDYVADLGANIGVYALELSRLVGTSGRVYSFEPIEENFNILQDVAKAKRLSNVHLYRAAIGSHAGQREMLIPKTRGFSGLYTAHLVRPGEEGHLETVEVFRLDDLLERRVIPRLDFIRADVAGAEFEVIEGARSLLTISRPGLLLGLSRVNGDRAFSALRALGYRPFLYAGSFKEIVDRSPGSYLHFFLHPESRFREVFEKSHFELA